MHEHRLLVIMNQAKADLSRPFFTADGLQQAMEYRCLDVLELAEYVRALEGRLDAVCDVVSDAAAFGDDIAAACVLEAVRGQRAVRDLSIKYGDIRGLEGTRG